MAANSSSSPPLTSVDNNSNSNSNSNYISSISQLRTLSTALSNFHRRYDELQQHLLFIQTTIDSKLPTSSIAASSSSLPIINVTAEKTKPLFSVSETKPNGDDDNNNNNNSSDFEPFTPTTCGRSLRRFIVSHLSDVEKLRKEVPKALKLSANPAKMVMECFGKFYLQGRRAYTKDSPMVSGREASILVLEYFLLMENNDGGVVIGNEVKQEAYSAAVAWRKRLWSEGGLYRACEADARGLLLLISSYGIPPVFQIQDVIDLIRSCNINRISAALRCSPHLLAKIPEIIEQMLKNRREVEAVDIVYTFDFQDRYPPKTVLKSFLSKANEIAKRKRTEADDLSAVVIKDKKHLADLKALLKCWEYHKIDPAESFPDLNISEKISNLEKEITVLDKKVREDAATKRKEKEIESSKRSKPQDARRLHFPGHDPILHNAVGQAAERSTFPGHHGYIDSPSLHHRYGVGDIHATRILHDHPVIPVAAPRGSVGGPGLLHEYAASTRFGSGDGLIAAETEGGFLSRDPYAASHLGMHVNANPYSGELYRWRGDVASDERFVNQTYGRQPLHSGYDSLYKQLPALEGFAGLPNHPAAIRSSASDLYQFADSVLDSELQHKGATFPGVNLHPKQS